MRLSPNDRAGLAKAEPERRCILTGEHGPRAALIRLAVSPDGDVAPDVRARAPGRGAWIGVSKAALETALAKGKLKGALARAFKTQGLVIPEGLPDQIEAALARNALDRLGLEARAGMLQTGSERIIEAARKGQVALLLHAADASADGSRKIDQAWRVGVDREGSGDTGVSMIVTRETLGRALGRENVVHIGVTDRGAAQRIGTALARWHMFIGREPVGLPCEISAQGPSAAHSSTGAFQK